MKNFLDRDSNTLTISEFYDNYMLKKYNFDPPYQRRDAVWNLEKKSFLIDSILKNFPIPPIFLHKKLDPISGKTKYEVIDGKQRLTSIVEFIDSKIPLPEDFGGEQGQPHILNGLRFSEIEGLAKKEKEVTEYLKRFWDYKVSIEYLDIESQEDVDKVFERLNKNGEPLNRQELRHAKYYNSDIFTLVREFLKLPYWQERKRYLDQARMEDEEFLSELLFMTLTSQVYESSPDTLDNLYKEWTENEIDEKAVRAEFNNITRYLESLGLDYDKYKINGVSHLYGLWCFAHYCVTEGIPVDEVKDRIKLLYEELRLRNFTGFVDDYRKSMSYATKSRSQREKRFIAMKNFCKI